MSRTLETGTGMSTRKHPFLKFLLLVLAICVGLELGLRLFGYGSYTLYRPDERLLWVPRAGTTLTMVNHLPITINDQGLRYPVDLQPKQNDELRIITFGDSATQGWGVDDKSHYSADLERQLNAGSCPGRHVQVANGGVNAYPNSLVGEKLKEVVTDDRTRPDIAVRAYSFNTNLERLTQLKGEDREKFLRRVEWKAIARRSAMYNFFIEDVLRTYAYYRIRHLLMAGSLSTIEGNGDLDVDQFKANLGESLRLCRANNVQLVLLLLGSQDETTDLHPFQKAMLEFARAENIPIVNMIDIMRTKDQNAVYMDIAHPTKLGHQLIADQLEKTIRTLPSYSAACEGTPPVKLATSDKVGSSAASTTNR